MSNGNKEDSVGGVPMLRWERIGTFGLLSILVLWNGHQIAEGQQDVAKGLRELSVVVVDHLRTMSVASLDSAKDHNRTMLMIESKIESVKGEILRAVGIPK